MSIANLLFLAARYGFVDDKSPRDESTLRSLVEQAAGRPELAAFLRRMGALPPEKLPWRPFVPKPAKIAPLRQSLDAEKSRSRPWEGDCDEKPWQYKVTAAIPVLDTPDELSLVVELLRLQTERPYIVIIDTGSTPENLAKIERLRAQDVEVHSLRFNGRRHPSDFPAVAMDFAFAAAQTEFVFATHADVFPRRRDLIEWLLTICPSKAPVVGYQITPRPHRDWERMVSHTCSLYHMPAVDQARFVWNFREFSREQGIPPEPHPLRPNWPDTEVPGNYRLWEAGMAALLIGEEKNYERTIDENIDHCRTLTAGLLYSPTYYAKASAWAEDAKRAARERVEEWRQEWSRQC